MIELATRRRLAGDWRGACAAANVEVGSLEPRRRAFGDGFAARAEDTLQHLVPDLLRWHLPRDRHGLLRPWTWYPLELFTKGHALVAHTPERRDRPQRIVLRVERLDSLVRGRRDDTLLHLRERWDSRCTPDALSRCGGVTRLPFFTATGERLAEDALGGAGPEGLVERAIRLDDAGRHADAWAEAGFRLEVLLFDPRLRGGRVDPAALDPAAFDQAAPDEVRAAARRTAVERSLAWLRPMHTTLADAARRTAVHVAELRWKAPLRAASSPVAPRLKPWPAKVDARFGIVRIDVRGRHIVLQDLGTAQPRARLLPSGTPAARLLARMPRIPHELARRPPMLDALRSGRLRPDDLHPLVHAALFPGRRPPGPPPAPPLRDTVRVRCDRATHEVALRGGEVVIPHPPAEAGRELMIRALGGEVQGCVAAREGWRDPAVRLPKPMRALRAGLMALFRHGDTAAVTAALDRGLDPHVRDERGRTLLHLLPWLPDADLLPRLLGAGLDVHARDEAGETPLHAAVEHGSEALIRGLLAAGADPRAQGNGRMAGWTTRRGLGFLRDLLR